MKVLHIIIGLSTGGAEMMLYKLLSFTDKHKLTPFVISLVEGSDELKDQIKTLDIPVYSLGINRSSFISFFKIFGLIKLMRQIKPDIIQGWMYHGNLAATLAGTIASGHPPVVWNIRHSLLNIKYEKRTTRWVIRLNRLFSRVPNAIIYNSYLSMEQHEEYGFHVLRSQHIPNGIDLKAFEGSPTRKENIRARYKIPSDAIVVGHAARYHPMKDHRGFLGAAVTIAKTDPAVHFVLLGRDVTLKNQDLSCLIPDDLLEQFHLLGEQNDIPGLMNMMDIFCMSSAWGEGWPNVLGEAMAAGVPCVATDVGDSKEILGNTGIIVPPGDPDLLRMGLESLIRMKPEQRTALGETASSRIKEHYTLDQIVEQYESLYDVLITS